MPSPHHLDDDTAEALLRDLSPASGAGQARQAGGSDDDPLTRFLRDVGDVAHHRAPAPSPALALVLRSGFSTPPLDPLMTAASLPTKEKHHTTMKATGIFRGLTGKVLAVSTVLLVGVGTAAAAGALPGTSQHSTAAVHVAAPALVNGSTNSAKVATKVPAVHHASAGAQVRGATGSATTGAAGVSAGVSAAGVNAGVAAPTGSLGTGSIVGHAGSGATGTVSGITTALTGCLSGIIGTSTGQPMLALNSVIPTVVSCVKNVIASLPVPAAVSSCVTSLLNSLGGLPFIGAGTGMLDLTGCMTTINLSTCIQAALNSVGGLLGGQLGVNNIPSTIEACAGSIVDGVLNLVNSLLNQLTGGAVNITGIPSLPGVTGAAVTGAGVHGSVSVSATP